MKIVCCDMKKKTLTYNFTKYFHLLKQRVSFQFFSKRDDSDGFISDTFTLRSVLAKEGSGGVSSQQRGEFFTKRCMKLKLRERMNL